MSVSTKLSRPTKKVSSAGCGRGGEKGRKKKNTVSGASTQLAMRLRDSLAVRRLTIHARVRLGGRDEGKAPVEATVDRRRQERGGDGNAHKTTRVVAEHRQGNANARGNGNGQADGQVDGLATRCEEATGGP